MLENSTDITQSNFRQTRRSYGITLQQIADKCCLSKQTVANYEQFTGQYTKVRTTDDNARIIRRALHELIDAKISEAFPFGVHSEKEEGEEDMDKPAAKYTIHKGYNKAKVTEILKEYCISKDVTLTEFCRMCGVAYSTVSPNSAKQNPVLRETVVAKICTAAGIDPFKFDCAKLNSDSKPEEESVDAVTDNNKLASSVTEISIDSSTLEDIVPSDYSYIVNNSAELLDDAESAAESKIETKDKKYVYQNGNYYEECIIVKHVRRQITKDQFMSAVCK